MKKQIILLILIVSYIHTSTIQEIIITGNKFTNDNTILSLISHAPGDSINITLAIEDQANLFNSGLFYDAIIYPDNSTYYIFVFEKPKIIARPELDKDDILGWSYGGSLLLNNIKGENKKLKINALIGASNLLNIKYCQPKLQNTNDSININLYNKSYDILENNYTVYKKGLKTSLSFFTDNPTHQINISNQLEYSKLYFEGDNSEKNYSIINSLTYQLNQLNNLFQLKISHLFFQYIYKNYFTMDLENRYLLYFNSTKDSGRLLIKNQLKINGIGRTIPVYNKKYIISEDFVRGYDINNIPENSNISDNLLWNNIIASTIQVELPFYNLGSISTDLLFFWDWGLGFNNWWYLSESSKIRSFGVGIRYNIMKMGSVDICIGMNPYNGNKEVQGIVNFTSF